MTRCLRITLIATIVVIIAVCSIVVSGKIKQLKETETPHLDPSKVQFCVDMEIGIVLTPQFDGTIDYKIPIGMHYEDQYDVQYTTLNTKYFPARILLQVNDELKYDLIIDLVDGNVTLQSEEVPI